VAGDLSTCLADDVAGRLLVARHVHEVAHPEPQSRAIGQELIEIGVREAGWPLGLVLRVDHRYSLAVDPPDDVKLQQDTVSLVQVMLWLADDPAAVRALDHLTQRNCDEVLEQ
jgi:hypothetical protein